MKSKRANKYLRTPNENSTRSKSSQIMKGIRPKVSQDVETCHDISVLRQF